jgi:hypothetical protein
MVVKASFKVIWMSLCIFFLFLDNIGQNGSIFCSGEDFEFGVQRKTIANQEPSRSVSTDSYNELDYDRPFTHRKLTDTPIFPSQSFFTNNSNESDSNLVYDDRPSTHRKLADSSTLSLPIGLRDQAKEEAGYLKLHKCKDAGEAYAASYLITREHLIYQFTGLNLSWVNCEMGSFIMMNQRAEPKRNVNGSMTQSLDVLDFSVIHLSWYERLQKRHFKGIENLINRNETRGVDLKSVKGSKNNKNQFKIDANLNDIEGAMHLLKDRALKLRNLFLPSKVPELNRTVAVMPFLGADMGAGHSKLTNRLELDLGLELGLAIDLDLWLELDLGLELDL